MSRTSRNLIAWGAAALCLVVAAGIILAAQPVYVARARAEISKSDIVGGGLAKLVRVDFTQANRTLPMDFLARLNSRATIQRAVEIAGLPADGPSIDDAEEMIGVRLLPGTTLLEVIVTSRSQETARILAGAVFQAHEALRRDRRSVVSNALLASLTEAARTLQGESQSLAVKLGGINVRPPLVNADYHRNMDAAVVDVELEKARLRAAIGRLEAVDLQNPESLLRHLDDQTIDAVGASPFAGNTGYAMLRSSLAAKLAEFASKQAVHGANSEKVRQARSEVAALQQLLKSYIQGQTSQLRAQFDGMDQAGGAIEQRIQSKENLAKSARAAEASPEFEELSLKQEAVRAEFKQIELRRHELLVFQQVNEPSLVVVDPAQVSETMESRHRGARLVFAGFGALLVGFSLTLILDRRALALI